MAKSPQAHLLSDEAGSLLVEVGLVFAFILILSFGVVELGRFFWAKVTIDRSAWALSRCAALGATTCLPNTQGLPSGASVTSATGCPAGATGKSVSYSFRFIIPYWPGLNPVTISASACYKTQ